MQPDRGVRPYRIDNARRSEKTTPDVIKARAIAIEKLFPFPLIDSASPYRSNKLLTPDLPPRIDINVRDTSIPGIPHGTTLIEVHLEPIDHMTYKIGDYNKVNTTKSGHRTHQVLPLKDTRNESLVVLHSILESITKVPTLNLYSTYLNINTGKLIEELDPNTQNPNIGVAVFPKDQLSLPILPNMGDVPLEGIVFNLNTGGSRRTGSESKGMHGNVRFLVPQSFVSSK